MSRRLAEVGGSSRFVIAYTVKMGRLAFYDGDRQTGTDELRSERRPSRPAPITMASSFIIESLSFTLAVEPREHGFGISCSLDCTRWDDVF